MSEQPSQKATTTVAGDRWDDPITPERAVELKALADRQRAWADAPDHQGRASAFQDVELTGADVFWLAGYALAGPGCDMVAALEQLRARRVRFSTVHSSVLHLEGANLHGAHLEGAFLRGAHLEGAYLRGAHLEGAALGEAYLEGAYLRFAFLNSATVLTDIHLVDAKGRTGQVADVRWGGVNLAVVDWTPFTDRKAVLGDEQTAREFELMLLAETEKQRKQPRRERGSARAAGAAPQNQVLLQFFQAAVRANRHVATALRDQGMNEEADHFAYRAQVLQRALLRRQGKRVKWLWWWFLGGIAGYGYKPQFTLGWYVLLLLVSAAVYWWQSAVFAPDRLWYDALGESLAAAITAVHGRGFFPGQLRTGWELGTAAFDAVAGLVLEASFVATFVQRFFAR